MHRSSIEAQRSVFNHSVVRREVQFRLPPYREARREVQFRLPPYRKAHLVDIIQLSCRFCYV